MNGLLVGIDVGTSAVKAIAVDPDRGTVVAVASSPLELDTPRPGFAEQDARSYHTAAALALRALGERADFGAVRSVGLTGQMHTAVLLDAARQPIRPAILWCDSRTTEECQSILASIGMDRLAATVGNRPLEGFTLPKILWLRRHEPETYARLEHVVMPKDYVGYWLTSEIATDPSDASGTLAFDPRAGCWSAEVLGALDLPVEIWPRLGGSSEIVGHVGDVAAAATGLPRGTPVVHGAADNAAGAVGLGVVRPGTAMLSIGTSGVVVAPTSEFALSPSMPLHTFAHAAPNRFYRMGVVLSAGGALRWYRDVLCDGERLAAELRGADPYEILTEAASTSRPGAGGVVFLPYLLGERTPHHDASARGALVGLTARTTKADVSRAVLEGISFALADSLALVRQADPTAVSTIRVTGGGAKSAFWRQLLADVLDADITLTTSTEGPAFGAALLGGVATGLFGSIEEATDALVHTTRVVRAEPVAVARYGEIARVYRGLYTDLASRFRELGKIE